MSKKINQKESSTPTDICQEYYSHNEIMVLLNYCNNSIMEQ